jgi:hypothetical protein
MIWLLTHLCFKLGCVSELYILVKEQIIVCKVSFTEFELLGLINSPCPLLNRFNTLGCLQLLCFDRV